MKSLLNERRNSLIKRAVVLIGALVGAWGVGLLFAVMSMDTPGSGVSNRTYAGPAMLFALSTCLILAATLRSVRLWMRVALFFPALFCLYLSFGLLTLVLVGLFKG